MPKAAARPTLSATLRLPERSENSTIAAISSIRPATIRSHALQPPPPTIARNGFIRRDGSSHRCRCASSACHHSTATPAPASSSGPKDRLCPVASVTSRSTPIAIAPTATSGP